MSFMSKSNIAVMGDRDSVLLFQAVGIDVYFETEEASASRRLHALARSGYRVIFLTEELYALCAQAILKYKTEAFPAIIPIPSNKGASGASMEALKANVEKAIGSDILFS